MKEWLSKRYIIYFVILFFLGGIRIIKLGIGIVLFFKVGLFVI